MKDAENQAAQIKKRLAERKKKLADTQFAGLSDEEKKKQLEAAMSQYERIGFTVDEERQR